MAADRRHDAQVLALLGPKTEADTAPAPKAPKKTDAARASAARATLIVAGLGQG